MFTAAPDGTIDFINDAARRYFGLTDVEDAALRRDYAVIDGKRLSACCHREKRASNAHSVIGVNAIEMTFE